MFGIWTQNYKVPSSNFEDVNQKQNIQSTLKKVIRQNWLQIYSIRHSPS